MFGNMLGFSNLFGFASMQSMDMISMNPCASIRLSTNQMYDDYVARQGLFLTPNLTGSIFPYGSGFPMMPDFTSSIMNWGKNMQQALLTQWADPFAMNNGSLFGMGNMGGAFGWPGMGMQSPWMTPGGTQGAQGGGSSDSGLSAEERIAKKNVEGYTKFLKELISRDDLLKNDTNLKAKIEAALDDCSKQVEGEDGNNRPKTYAEKLEILKKAFEDIKKAEPDIVTKYIKGNTSIQLDLRGTNAPLKSALESIGYISDGISASALQQLYDTIDTSSDKTSTQTYPIISGLATDQYCVLDLISSWNDSKTTGLMETLFTKYKDTNAFKESGPNSPKNQFFNNSISPLCTEMIEEADKIVKNGKNILDSETIETINELKGDLNTARDKKNESGIKKNFNELYVLLRRAYIKIAQNKLNHELEFLGSDLTGFLATETEADLKKENIKNVDLDNDTFKANQDDIRALKELKLAVQRAKVSIRKYGPDPAIGEATPEFEQTINGLIAKVNAFNFGDDEETKKELLKQLTEQKLYCIINNRVFPSGVYMKPGATSELVNITNHTTVEDINAVIKELSGLNEEYLSDYALKQKWFWIDTIYEENVNNRSELEKEQVTPKPEEPERLAGLKGKSLKYQTNTQEVTRTEDSEETHNSKAEGNTETTNTITVHQLNKCSITLHNEKGELLENPTIASLKKNKYLVRITTDYWNFDNEKSHLSMAISEFIKDIGQTLIKDFPEQETEITTVIGKQQADYTNIITNLKKSDLKAKNKTHYMPREVTAYKGGDTAGEVYGTVSVVSKFDGDNLDEEARYAASMPDFDNSDNGIVVMRNVDVFNDDDYGIYIRTDILLNRILNALEEKIPGVLEKYSN